MTILLLGCNGQLGWELQRSLAPLGDVVALQRDARHNPQGLCGDLSDLDGLRATVHALRPQAVVNAAAHTAVDKAESEPDLADLLNARAPAVLAEAAQALGAWLVHYSTDYVFDGSGSTPWVETDPTGPLGVYGRSKLAGEQAIVQTCARHLVLRTSWVYAARGGNFAKTMLRLARERELLQVINDQCGAPTGAELLADASAHALRQALAAPDGSEPAGVYHLAAAGQTTWYDYARFVIDAARAAVPDDTWKVQEIRPVASSAFVTAARRPLNSRLDTSRFRRQFGLHLPHWTQGVDRLLKEIHYGKSL